MIDYHKFNYVSYPKPWNEVEETFLKESKFYNNIVSKILSNARTNVCPRFMNVNK